MNNLADGIVNKNGSHIISPNSYAGIDIGIYAAVSNKYTDIVGNTTPVNNESFIQIRNLQTLSYSLYRDKKPVVKLGDPNAAGFTRGHVTVAGTMVFTVLEERVLRELIRLSFRDAGYEHYDLMRIDQMPPIDIFITFGNEYGYKSRMAIYGVEFMNEGQVMSVHDLITENTVNYLATSISPMRLVESPDPKEMAQIEIENMSKASVGLSLPAGEFERANRQLEELRYRVL